MSEFLKSIGGHPVELECKPDFESAIERVYAWYEGEMLDRPPIRFSRHNADFDLRDYGAKSWPSLRERWFDAQFQLETFMDDIKGRTFHAETFPVYWPNLGPNVFAACYGCPYEFEETTAWTSPLSISEEDDFPQFAWDSEYFRKLDELTDLALGMAKGKFIVGYTDMHAGVDCVAALRGMEELLFDFLDKPEWIRRFVEHCERDFNKFYDHFDAKLKANSQLSVTWMNIPSFGKMHIPSCDFSSMISPALFDSVALEGLKRECERMDHNIFHVDGKNVARNIGSILTLPKLNGIQWVQGMGGDLPIMQWVPFIKKVQSSGKGVVVDLTAHELEQFISCMDPKGLYLCIASEDEQQEKDIIDRVLKW